MNWTWFSLQLVWTIVKLSVVLAVVGTIALFPFGAALATLAVVGLAAKGWVSFKVAAVLLTVLFLIQGMWMLKWGEGLSIIEPYI